MGWIVIRQTAHGHVETLHPTIANAIPHHNITVPCVFFAKQTLFTSHQFVRKAHNDQSPTTTGSFYTRLSKYFFFFFINARATIGRYCIWSFSLQFNQYDEF